MSQEDTYAQIDDRISRMGFKSVNLRLALIREGDQWKVFLGRAVFELGTPWGNMVRHKQDDFVLADFSMSILDFGRFLRYLRRVNVEAVKLEEGKVVVGEDVPYDLGDYQLCLAGNMSNGGLMFLRRQHGTGHGIDHPLYMTQYIFHPSIVAQGYQRVNVVAEETPFTGVLDAVNHFWGTNYETYSIPSNLQIYLPVYDGSIAACRFEKDKVVVTVDMDENRAQPGDLWLSMVVEKRFGDYRKKIRLTGRVETFDTGFDPVYAQLFLHRGKELLDEFYYTSSSQISNENQFFKEQGLTVVPSEPHQPVQKGPVNPSTREINPVFKGRDFVIEQDLCFVLMPFEKPFDDVYYGHIKPIMTRCGFRVMRADDIFRSTPIVDDIWEHINKARLVIADVSGKNPNVFYELGISHTVGTEVVIIAQNDKDIPFDVTHVRHFRYENSEEGLSRLRDSLEKVCKTLDNNRTGD